jgi:hypothetical protein
LTKLSDAPFSLSAKTSGANKAVDPASGRYVVKSHGGGWYEYDIINDQWSADYS